MILTKKKKEQQNKKVRKSFIFSILPGFLQVTGEANPVVTNSSRLSPATG